MGLMRTLALTDIIIRGHILVPLWWSREHRRAARCKVLTSAIPRYFKRYLPAAAAISPMDSAYDYFRNYINPSAPNRDCEELAEFVRFFNEHGGEGNAVAIYACQIAQSKRAFKWAFIRTVLNGWKCAGVYTLAQCEAHERDWQERRKTGNAKGNPTSGTPHYARGTKLNPDGTWEYDPGDTSGSL